ncbi:MAG: DUF86 domain-containing protein [Burkholderiaceae bacterium]|nr:DUF86 domain-containing protein [Burkholderiaceae bacterium]
MSRSWLLYLDDLIAAGEKLARIAAGRSRETLADDEVAFDATLFNLQVIGEAIKRLPPTALAQLPVHQRQGPARLRDLIAHHYFAVDPDLIWEAATVHVPALLEQARRLREAAEGDDGRPR